MGTLRIVLFLGLVFHKALWELLKRRARQTGSRTTAGTRPVKVVKALVLAFLAVQTLFLDVFPISEQAAILRAVGTVIYFIGLATAVAGRLQLGNNWADLEEGQILSGQSLVATGIYRHIRHPIYIGDILLLVGLELALNSWLVLATGIPLVVVIRQSLAEEAALSRAFPAYDAYCKRSRRFIPFLV